MTFPFPPAPFPGLDDAQRAAMLALGPTWAQDIQENRRRVCDIYDAIHGALPADDLRVAPAQAYGDDPRQQLDLYLPIAHDQTARPIVAFVHGGAFLRGNKDATPHIYANVPSSRAPAASASTSNTGWRHGRRIPPEPTTWRRRWAGYASTRPPGAGTRNASCCSAIRPVAAMSPPS